MDRVYLQLNLVNMITVVIMAAAGIVLLQFIASGIRQYQAQGTAS